MINKIIDVVMYNQLWSSIDIQILEIFKRNVSVASFVKWYCFKSDYTPDKVI